jgi:hypothetical protein
VLRLPWGRVALAAGILDLVLFVVGVVPGYRYTLRTTTFERTPAGKWVYRGRIGIPAARLSLFIFRYGVEIALLGQIYLVTPTLSPAVATPTFAAALIAVNALFAASTGLVMGETVAIRWAYHVAKGPEGATLNPVPSVEPLPPSAPSSGNETSR